MKNKQAEELVSRDTVQYTKEQKEYRDRFFRELLRKEGLREKSRRIKKLIVTG